VEWLVAPSSATAHREITLLLFSEYTRFETHGGRFCSE
jgi:hypothetical protein